MEDKKKIIIYKDYVYEGKQLSQKEMSYIYDQFYKSMKDLTAALNVIKDTNIKRGISSILLKQRNLFNDKIKNPNLYGPKSIEDMQNTAQNIDQKMKAQQGLPQASPSSPDQAIDDRSSQAS